MEDYAEEMTEVKGRLGEARRHQGCCWSKTQLQIQWIFSSWTARGKGGRFGGGGGWSGWRHQLAGSPSAKDVLPAARGTFRKLEEEGKKARKGDSQIVKKKRDLRCDRNKMSLST